MSRDWRLYLGDMILCCEKIATFVGASTRDEFLANVLVYDDGLEHSTWLSLRLATRHRFELRAQAHRDSMGGVAYLRITMAGAQGWTPPSPFPLPTPTPGMGS